MPCKHGGKCTPTERQSYNCTCTADFKGEHCGTSMKQSDIVAVIEPNLRLIRTKLIDLFKVEHQSISRAHSISNKPTTEHC